MGKDSSAFTKIEKVSKKSGYSHEIKEILSVYLPLLTQLPSLRDKPDMLIQKIKSERGGVSDVVTAADIFIQKQLKEQLADKHKNWQFWGEEGDDQIGQIDKTKQYLLITDPIEGTNNFLARKEDQWGSVLALVENKIGTPVVGMVAHPSSKKLYLGIRGAGAHAISYDDKGSINNINPMSVKPEFDNFTYNNSPHFEPKLIRQVDNFFSMGKIDDISSQVKVDKLRKKVMISRNDYFETFVDPESGALEIIRYKGTIYFKTSNEMAAVFVILNELGGKITDGGGENWHFGLNTLISARNESDYEFLKELYDKTKNSR